MSRLSKDPVRIEDSSLPEDCAMAISREGDSYTIFISEWYALEVEHEDLEGMLAAIREAVTRTAQKMGNTQVAKN